MDLFEIMRLGGKGVCAQACLHRPSYPSSHPLPLLRFVPFLIQGEARRVVVPLPESTLDSYRGLTRKERAIKAREAKESRPAPQASSHVPPRQAFAPAPCYIDCGPVAVLAEYWAGKARDGSLPVPRHLNGSSASTVPTNISRASSSFLSMGTRHVMDRHSLLTTIRSLMGTLSEVLMEGLQRGLHFQSLVSTEAAVDALYKYVPFALES